MLAKDGKQSALLHWFMSRAVKVGMDARKDRIHVMKPWSLLNMKSLEGELSLFLMTIPLNLIKNCLRRLIGKKVELSSVEIELHKTEFLRHSE